MHVLTSEFMEIEDDILEHIAEQGLGHIVALSRCPNCNYIAKSSEEETLLARVESPCPHCGITGHGAGIAPNNYLQVANWIGEYAASPNRRDHSSAVLLFCSFVEGMLETLKSDYLRSKSNTSIAKVNKRRDFKDIFGMTLKAALNDAPSKLKEFPIVWGELRDKRNRFLHGHSSYLIGAADARQAVSLAAEAVNVYRWLNNKHCLKD